jgi:hypothetical protein
VVHEVRFGSPKTAKGSRVIELDPATVAALRSIDGCKPLSGYSSAQGGVTTVWCSAASTGRVASGSVLSVVR